MPSFITFLAYLFLALTPLVAKGANSIQVAVASNFLASFLTLKEEFIKSSPYKILESPGSTAKLTSQILRGAPFDIFLSADTQHVQLLINKNKALPQSRFIYAKGHLAVFHKKKGLPISLKDLTNAKSIAIANPKLAPYGRAAKELLSSLGLFQAGGPRILRGESVGQALQFALSDSHIYSIVSLAQVKTTGFGSYFVVPKSYYSEISQEAVLLNKGKAKAGALEFLAFLQSSLAKKIIYSHGYTGKRSF